MNLKLLVPFLVVSALMSHAGKYQQQPWMLLITPLEIPTNAPMTKYSFNVRCKENLEKNFKETAYKTVLLNPSQNPELISNHKRDLVLYTDMHDHFHEGKLADTLVVWLKYRTGFSYARIPIPYKKHNRREFDEIPVDMGLEVFQVARERFLSEIELHGLPQGTELHITDGLQMYPPCSIIMPAGEYTISSYHPQFFPREDSVYLAPGRIVQKRIVMLPR